MTPEAESALERFERLAEEYHRETGLWPPGKDRPAAAGSDGITDMERATRWQLWLAERRRAGEPRDAEPAANSPEDAGHAAPAPSSRPEPHTCKGSKGAPGCGAPIFWAQVLDEHGQRIFYEDGRGQRRTKSMPVDVTPTPRGNVVLYQRQGEGVVCRVLRGGESPPAGAQLRTSHFATCPHAKSHRKGRARR